MNELEKLKKLLHHWSEHNEEHAETYRDWAKKTHALGHIDLSEILETLYRETKKLTGLLEEAQKKIG
ncbi:MAG TPA: hypothetical protein DCP92_01590 [Nitrospiraceae bacterium]|jgi:hypothetical protein|nr:hypothetical protein [Nitrospiraceae bacterium]